MSLGPGTKKIYKSKGAATASEGSRLAILLGLFLLAGIIGLSMRWRKQEIVASNAQISSQPTYTTPRANLQHLRGEKFQRGGIGESLLKFLEDDAPDYMQTALVFRHQDFAQEVAQGLSPAKLNELEELAAVLIAFPSMKVEIAGNSDERADTLKSVQTSTAEAEAVRGILIRLGVPREQVLAKGYGFQFPITDNATPEARAKNRRVELFIRELP